MVSVGVELFSFQIQNIGSIFTALYHLSKRLKLPDGGPGNEELFDKGKGQSGSPFVGL